ncbi:MAG: IPT/TIG domain-containing protein [archaeon]|nr:IPT/TIG domain-containing protein [archaeon]
MECTVPPSRGKEKRIPEISLNGQDWDKNPGVAFYYYEPPFISSVSPDNISPKGGTVVNVTGTNFPNTGTVICKFANEDTVGKYVDDSHVNCTSPPIQKPGKVPLKVAFRENEFSDPFPLDCFDNPVLESIDPQTGPEPGDTLLKCKGKKFPVGSSNSIKCVFNKKILREATVIDDETLYCSTPSVLNKNGINEGNVKEYPVDLTMDNGAQLIGKTQKFQYYKQHTIDKVEPSIGPVEGLTKVKLYGQDFSNLDKNKLSVRFATYKAKILEVGKNNIITVEAPPANFTGPVAVQISFNDQQFDEKNHNKNNTYIYHKFPVVSGMENTKGPTNGENDLILHGVNFVKAYDTPKETKDEYKPEQFDDIYYKFIDASNGEELGPVKKTKPKSNQDLILKTPKLKDPKKMKIKLSYNDQDYKTYEGFEYELYKLPSIKKISPLYAPLKGKENEKVTVSVDNLSCNEPPCEYDCLFKTNNTQFVVNGTYTKANTISCDMPKVRNPETYNVEISPKGEDTYTNNGHNFTFYDPFVLRVEPQIISTKGGTDLDIYGYGFADTSELKALFGSSEEGGFGINCSGRKCTQSVEFIDSQHLRVKSRPRSGMKINATDEDLQNEKFPVEVSVYGDDFTNNGVSISYFDEPDLISDLDDFSDDTVYSPEEKEELKSTLLKSIPSNSETFIPIPLDPTNINKNFDKLKSMFKFTCKYKMINSEAEKETGGVIASYPADSKKMNLFFCESPNWDEVGKARIYISMNGKDYSNGFYNIEFTEPLYVYKMSPSCGPIEGNTEVELIGTGFRDEDDYYFKWGPQNIIPMRENFIFQDATEAEKNELGLSGNKFPIKKMRIKAPPATHQENTTGGPDTISLDKISLLPLNSLLENYNLNSFKNQKMEYYYYPQIYVEGFSPSIADTAEATPITVVGAFFQEKKDYDVKPICRFGDIDVVGNYKSNVRINCISPEYPMPNAVVPFSVSLNGKDFIKADKDFTFFSMIKDAKFGEISPKSGPVSGGTKVTIPSKSISAFQPGTPLTCGFEPHDNPNGRKDSPGFIEQGNDGNLQITCNTPGGWPASTKTKVLINLGGGNFIRTGADFFFHKIDDLKPSSGPFIGGGTISIDGGGVLNGTDTKMIFDGVSYDALNNTEGDKIQFPLPASKRGKYVGPVDLSLAMEGQDDIELKDGFYYYEQPTVDSFYPQSGPAKGKGKISVTGKNFREDFKGAVPSCKIGNYYGQGKVISNDEMVCTFNELPAPKTKPGEKVEKVTGYPFSIALNNQSFVEPKDGQTFKGYSLNKIYPTSGPISGNTLITVSGNGFTNSDNIRCRFGTPGWYSITQATYIDSNTITCMSPNDFKIPNLGQLSFSVPFSIAFAEDEFDPWTQTSHFFTFYKNPKLINDEPKEGQATETIPVVVEADLNEYYAHPSVAITEENYDVIGDQSHKSKELLEYEPIKCRFGQFGTTVATRINATHLTCLTPKIEHPEEVGYEKVDVEVAVNGQNFVKGDDVTYTFIGEGAGSMIWAYIFLILFIAILAVALVALASSFWNRIGVSPKEGESSQVRNKKIKYLIDEEYANRINDNLPYDIGN